MAHLLAAAPALAPPAPTVSWIPGAERLTPRPKYLDGSLAADGGFDPLGFCVNGLPAGMPGTFSAAQPSDSDLKANLMWMREAEIKHSRLAMLAAAGWPLAELWHGGLAGALGALPGGVAGIGAVFHDRKVMAARRGPPLPLPLFAS